MNYHTDSYEGGKAANICIKQVRHKFIVRCLHQCYFSNENKNERKKVEGKTSIAFCLTSMSLPTSWLHSAA